MAMLFSQPVCTQGREMAHPVVPLAMQGLSEGEPRHGHAVVTESLMLSVIIVHVLTLALSLSISCCNYHPADLSPALSHVSCIVSCLLHCLMGTSPLVHPMTSVLLCTSLVFCLHYNLCCMGTLTNLYVVHYELALVKVAELQNSQETVHCFLSYPICV